MLERTNIFNMFVVDEVYLMITWLEPLRTT